MRPFPIPSNITTTTAAAAAAAAAVAAGILTSNSKRLITMATPLPRCTSIHLQQQSPPPAPEHLPQPLRTLLGSCRTMKELKQIHSQMIRTGLLVRSPREQRRLLAFCCAAECGDMAYARLLFDGIPDPDLFLWNSMIRGHAHRDCPEAAVLLYIEMLTRGFSPDSYTFPFLLKCFTRDAAIMFGDELHAHALKFGLSSNAHVRSAFLHMYALSGEVDVARELFERSPQRDAVMWNALISGYNRIKLYGESCRLFDIMLKENVAPTKVTHVLVLSACAKLKDLERGRWIHQLTEGSSMLPDMKLQNALIDLYAQCGDMNESWKIFQAMSTRDVISWTAVVAGFAKSGQVDRARLLFDQMPERDSVSWTAMIDGYVSANRFKESLEVFRKMQAARVVPDQFTMVSVLTACSQLGALEVGEWIKVYMERNKIKMDIFVGNALIDMYSKCGCIESAAEVFKKMQRKDKFTWTAMITGLAVHGHGEEAFNMFHKMLRASVRPDEVTYIGVLTACAHAGMVDEGRESFRDMITTYNIMPNVTHYGCLVDLLGRAGQLNEALETITNMPMKPNSTVWGALLGACRVHKNIKIAELAAKNLVQLEPENTSAYVLLSNVYAKCNKWEEVYRVRQLMMEKGIKKEPGCSLIEMNGEVHEFVAGDRSHQKSREIYLKLEEMTEELRLAGYLPDTSEVSLNVAEEERANAINQHSEKLAITFGLISSEPGAKIRVFKNLRICIDCHNTIKYLSRIYGREIVVRDRNRFHHFRLGSCSCNEYW